jgi:hypothetical protein
VDRTPPDGQDREPVIGTGDPGAAAIIPTIHESRKARSQRRRTARRRGSRVVLDHGALEVYALAEDPEETRDLAATANAQDLLRQAAAESDRAFGPVEDLRNRTLVLPPEDLEALKSLGYVAGSAGSAPPRRVDLRRFVTDLQRLST